jgi:hypothetical protein
MYMYCQDEFNLNVHKWADMDMHVHRKPFRIKGDAQDKGLIDLSRKWTFAMPLKWRTLSE